MALKDRFIGAVNALLPQAWQVNFREAYGMFVDPDELQWRKLTETPMRDLPQLTQERMQLLGNYLWEQNLLANRLIELPVAYLLAEGVKLKVEDPENQKVLDRFWRDPINDMDLKLAKKVRELAIFGEQVYPAFVNEQSGVVRIGYLDPAFIGTVVMDPDNPEQPIGVITKRDKKGNSRKFRVIINGPEEVFTQRTQGIRQTFDAGDAFFFRVNDLSSGSRGRSDLLAQADWLDAYDQFLFGEIDRASFLRAFIWDVTLKGATEKQVEERARKMAAPKPGSVRVHNDAEVWDPKSPSLGANDADAAARLFRNHVLGGATMPETWFGGGGNVNRATAGEMNEPTFKIYTMRQRAVRHILESIGRYALLKNHEAVGKGEIDWSDPKWDVRAQFPELAVRDTTKYASALQQVAAAAVLAITNKLITRRFAVQLIVNAAAQLGLEADPEELLADAEAEAAKSAEGDVFNLPAGVEPPAAAAAAGTPGAVGAVPAGSGGA